MSKIYMSRRKAVNQPSSPVSESGQRTDSGLGTSLVGGGMGAGLDALMQARFRQHFEDNQIPAAESEADRLASGVRNAFTPEAVKARMGEAMGADFSGVRFHTDSANAARTDAMGAQAYTSGKDVYFGEGGFDPGTAAHELVHTVQQGAVDSSVPTVSAPAGGVQMKKKRRNADKPPVELAPVSEAEEELPLGPDLQEMFEESAALQENPGQQESAAPAEETKKAGHGHSLHGGFFGRVEGLFARGKAALEDTPETEAKPTGFFRKLGSKIKKGFRSGMRTALNAVSGQYESFMRKQDRAMDNLALNREDFDKMSTLEKLKWMKANPMGVVAFARQSRLGGMLSHKSDMRDIVKEQLKTTKNPFKIAKAIFGSSGKWGDESKEKARQEAQQRQAFMSGLVDEAKSFLAEYEAQNAPAQQPGAGEASQGELPLGPDLQKLFEEGSGQGEQSEAEDKEDGSDLSAKDIIEKAQDLNEAAGELGMDEDTGDIIGDLLDAAESGIDTAEKREQGDTIGTIAGSFQTIGNISSAGSNLANKVSSMDGIGENTQSILEKTGSGLEIASESMNFMGSATNFVGSTVARTKLSKRLRSMNNTDAPGKQRERFRTLNQAYKMSKVNQMRSGTGAVSSMLDITTKALGMAEVGGPVAKLLGYLKKGVNFIGGAAADRIGRQTRSDVANEETGADEKIRAFMAWYKQKHNEELDDHDAKHAVLKAMGFESGKRREIFLSVTKDRAHRMAEDANAGDQESAGIVADMGLKKGSEDKYSESAVAERLNGGSDVDEEMKKVKKSRAFGL